MNIFLNVVLWKFQNVITLHNLGKKMLQRQYYSHFNMEKTDITDGILNTEKKKHWVLFKHINILITILNY